MTWARVHTGLTPSMEELRIDFRPASSLRYALSTPWVMGF